jgi:hypothetical protein
MGETVFVKWGKPSVEAISVQEEDATRLVEICEMACRYIKKFKMVNSVGQYWLHDWPALELSQIEDLIHRIFEATEEPR